MRKMITPAFALILAAALPAAAQTVYRCGNSYSQQPCVGGGTVQAPAQPPSTKDQAAARQETRREAKAADSLEKSRLKEEAKPAQVYVAPARTPAAAAEEKPAMSKPKKPPYFTAVAPGSKPAKKADKKSKTSSAPA